MKLRSIKKIKGYKSFQDFNLVNKDTLAFNLSDDAKAFIKTEMRVKNKLSSPMAV